jgi:hypothetical protein
MHLRLLFPKNFWGPPGIFDEWLAEALVFNIWRVLRGVIPLLFVGEDYVKRRSQF